MTSRVHCFVGELSKKKADSNYSGFETAILTGVEDLALGMNDNCSFRNLDFLVDSFVIVAISSSSPFELPFSRLLTPKVLCPSEMVK